MHLILPLPLTSKIELATLSISNLHFAYKWIVQFDTLELESKYKLTYCLTTTHSLSVCNACRSRSSQLISDTELTETLATRYRETLLIVVVVHNASNFTFAFDIKNWTRHFVDFQFAFCIQMNCTVWYTWTWIKIQVNILPYHHPQSFCV